MNEKHKILVVDDEHMNRKILSDLLKGDHQVILAKDGEQTLGRVAADPELDLILLDVMMPGMDGYEVLRRLKQIEAAKDIPVMFITALNSTGDEERGLLLGAVDYIAKPFHPAIVKARVENHLRFVRQRKLLETLAGKDGLTEIDNRRRFDDVLEKEWRRTQRNNLPLSLAMVDVDYFKPFNDNYGHARGDQVLKSVARALTWALHRPADLAARYGGEEFVLLFPDTDAEGAKALAEHVRNSVATLAIPHEFSQTAPHVTVSIGGATAPLDSTDPSALIEAADQMLYEAKQRGRNRVVWKGA